MSVESAQQQVQVTVGKDLSTARIGGYKVEVNPDSNVVVYTNDGVQTKPAAGETPAKGTHISEDFNTVVLNGATIERSADGHLVISTPGIVITKPVPANDTAAKSKTAPQVGDKMSDGTIYAGISPDTNKPMYATPADAPLTYTFNQAQKYAGKLDAHGHKDWRAPTKGELNVLWENRNKGKLKDTFNQSGELTEGWYCSSSPKDDSPGDDYVWTQRFRTGHHTWNDRNFAASLRCVRG
jgi:hypothetical protein